jgi:hypothetical protein
VHGRTTTLSMTPDLVAWRDSSGEPVRRALDLLGSGTPASAPVPGVREARVEDCKTGVEKDSDFWQVAVYMTFLPTKDTPLEGRTLDGRIVYRAREQAIAAAAVGEETRARILKLLRDVGGATPLPAVPSFDECRYCDIAECEHRIETPPPDRETELF